LVNERQAVSPEMALRLGRFFGNSPDFWINLQSAYDIAKAKHYISKELRKIKPLTAVSF